MDTKRTNDNILGFFTSSKLGDDDFNALFHSYIWGEGGMKDKLEKLSYKKYGKDLELALFEFYIRPIPALWEGRKEIEAYRPKERSIGIPVIVTDENFFHKTEEERLDFLKQTMLQRMDLLEKVVKRRKLDTNMDKLKSDLANALG